MPHQLALSKAKIGLMSSPNSAFFISICFNLIHKWNDQIPTAQTNGKYIAYNPKFFMDLSADERIFLVLHETLHVAYLHVLRGEGFNPRKYNMAADHVINLQLIASGFKMPKGGLADRQYAGMSTEEVYKLLPDDPDHKADMDIQPGDESPEEMEKAIQDILVQAAIHSKMQGDKPGTIPGEIQLYLNKLLAPVLPWNRILRKHITATSKSDYSFRKPNRRFFPKHILPSLHSEGLANLTIAVDISGSVSDEDFLVFISEVTGILKHMKPEKITLIQFDTSIHQIDTIRNVFDMQKLKFSGRGGTSITPVVEWANTNKPGLLLVFSDGEFYFRNNTSKVPTIWLIHNNANFLAPWGKVIHYKIGD